jgi:hypothetical protein
MSSCKREIAATVLQGKSTALGDDSGSETGIVAVDEGNTVAILVGYGEIHCVAMVMRWAAVVEDIGCFVWVEEFGSFSQIGLRDEFVCWDLFDVRVCNPPGCVCKGDTETFNHSMQVSG